MQMAKRDRERRMEAEGRVAVGRPSYAKDIEQRIASLQGASRSDLQRDDVRGGMSPLVAEAIQELRKREGTSYDEDENSKLA
jgi:hypothetical protein